MTSVPSEAVTTMLAVPISASRLAGRLSNAPCVSWRCAGPEEELVCVRDALVNVAFALRERRDSETR